MSAGPLWLFLSLIPGGVGFVLLAYGRKQSQWGMVVAGVVFMVYPYFTESLTALVGVGIVLGILTWAAVRGGWI
jgi:hypothetical protein